MTRRAHIVDTEVSAFGGHPPHGSVDCAATVVAAVLRRHPALAPLVGSLWLGTARPAASDGRESGIGISVAVAAGLPGVPAFDVHAYCASGNVAVYQAVREVQSGAVDVAIAVGVEHMSQYPNRGPLTPEAIPRWASAFSPAAYYGLCAAAYLEQYGVDEQTLAGIAVRNRATAKQNPNAAMGGDVTVEEVLSSRPISTPLTLFQCCANVDGSGAAIIVAEEVLSRLEPDWNESVAVAGMGFATATTPELARLTTFEEDVRSGAYAYAEAGVGPEDIGVVELHDAFTIAQAIHLEDLGIAERGQGALMGTDPTHPRVNPSGGLLGRGHPLGATGLAQFDAVRRAVSARGGFGLVHEAGGLQLLSQMLSVSVIVTSPRNGLTS